MFSRTLNTADWANVTIASGDFAEEVDKRGVVAHRLPLALGQAGVSAVTWVRRSRMMSSTVWAMTSGMRSRGRP